MPLTSENIRACILARLVSNAPKKRLGRTHIMKLVYFLQELKDVQLGYDFRLFTYGPFDSEVLSDLATLCNLGIIIERTVIYQTGYGYDINPTPQSEQLSAKLENTNAAIAVQVDEIVRDFADFNASELELRSTVHFVQREMTSENQNFTIEDMAERVRQIKPHFTLEKILARFHDMEKHHQFVEFVSQ